MGTIDTGVQETLNTNVQKILKCVNDLPDLQRKQLFDALKMQEFEERMLDGDIDAFREYLMLYCTEVKDGDLQIDLPAKWEFKWFKFSWDISELKFLFNEVSNKEDPYREILAGETSHKELGIEIAKLFDAFEDYVKAYQTRVFQRKFERSILNPIFEKYGIFDYDYDFEDDPYFYNEWSFDNEWSFEDEWSFDDDFYDYLTHDNILSGDYE